MHAVQLAVLAEIAAAVGVVNDPRLAVDRADIHHDVAGDVDEIAHIERSDCGHAFGALADLLGQPDAPQARHCHNQGVKAALLLLCHERAV